MLVSVMSGGDMCEGVWLLILKWNLITNGNAASESLNSLWNMQVFKWLCSYKGMYVTRTASFTQNPLDVVQKLFLVAFKRKLKWMSPYKGSALTECHHPGKMLFEIEWVPKASLLRCRNHYTVWRGITNALSPQDLVNSSHIKYPLAFFSNSPWRNLHNQRWCHVPCWGPVG